MIVSIVLEHLEKSYLDVALREMSRVSKYALIYWPMHGKHVQLKVYLVSRGYSFIVDLLNYFKKPYGVTARYKVGMHFWEIGMRGYLVRDLTNQFLKQLNIINSDRNQDWMPSNNFFLNSHCQSSVMETKND